MDDLISRQAAIELIHTLYPSAPIMRMNRKRWEGKYKPYIEAEKVLEKLPSVQPERKKGNWIYATNAPSGESCYVCSECGVKLDSRYTSYCGNCGSKMER